MLAYLHRLASPPTFFARTGRALPWLQALTALLLVAGAYQGLVVAPPDYQQGDSYRIMFVHVPSAWMSLFIYLVMTGAGVIALVWRVKLAEVIASASAPIGASFTFLTLATGALWGKPMWGAWWVWDARLTSELILLFLYLGYIGLEAAIPDARSAARATAILALVGSVNIPIIHFSVEWWSTLHQGTTVARLGGPSIHASMLVPLLLMAAGFKSFYFASLLARARCYMFEREQRSAWVQTLIKEAC